MSNENQRITDTQLVMQEKDAMVAVGKELFALAKPYHEQIDEVAFRNKALEFIKHISNLAGFCDKQTQSVIWSLVTDFSAIILDPNGLGNFTDTKVKSLIPMAMGIQVDFTKKPFRVVGLSVEALGAKVKGIVKRG